MSRLTASDVSRFSLPPSLLTESKVQPRIQRTPKPVKPHRKKPSSKNNKKLSVSTANNSKSILASCKLVSSQMPQVEHKEIVPTYRGKDAPISLQPPALGYRFEETKESLIMRDTFRSMFGNKHYRFRISTALNMSSSGAGIVNSTISVSALQFSGDFISLSTVFNEFFVVAMRNDWIPVSRYQYPLGGTSTLSVANLPVGIASLQHGATAYTSLAVMSDNYALAFHNTGDPFGYTWVNTEKSSESVVAEQSGNTQSWCTTGNVANYQGQVQLLSQSAPPALPFSQVLGTFITSWEVIFRVRE
jgi:hypothetical protein